MRKSTFTRSLASILPIVAAGVGCTAVPETTAPARPNIVLIFLDDAGWADFEPFGRNRYSTPNMRQLAEEGRQFHNFYVPQAVCSASRASLLTGMNPCRHKLHSAHAPGDYGLDASIPLLPELLKENGYVTGGFGKWHIGDQEATRPMARGFDHYAGIMYSNDMWAAHPENPTFWGRFPMIFRQDESIIFDSVTAEHQTQFTKWFTEYAVNFINTYKNQPFFLYVPHPQPHVPLFVSKEFEGKSGAGLYGDVMMELDWSLGEIMKSLRENKLLNNTIVIVTSDNGPWLSYGDHSGKTPYREGKGTSFDGGIRSPLIISYPPQIEAGTVSLDAFSTIDLLPTLCHLTGTPLPQTEIDGRNVWDLIRGVPGAVNPNEYYAISLNHRLQAIISSDGKWKLHLPHTFRTPVNGGTNGMPGKYEYLPFEGALFNLQVDPYEKMDMKAEYPEVAEELMRYAVKHIGKFY
jgi:arylsulfatase A